MQWAEILLIIVAVLIGVCLLAQGFVQAVLTIPKVDETCPMPAGLSSNHKNQSGSQNDAHASESHRRREIPRIIHFMWLDVSDDNAAIPERHLPRIQKFRDLNPEWQVRTWNVKQVQDLLDAHPELAPAREIFCKHRNGFKRGKILGRWMTMCDLARWCVMWVEGGVYSDLDFDCRKSLDGLIQGKSSVLAWEPHEHRIPMLSQQIFNGFIAFPPNSEFVWRWIHHMAKALNHPLKRLTVIGTTFTTALGDFYLQVAPLLSEPVTFVPTCEILPYARIGRSKRLKTLCPDDVPFVATTWCDACQPEPVRT